MNPIQMLDLKTQYQGIRQEIDAAIQEVLLSTAFIKGPQVKAFESELAAATGAAHVIGCANGTDALQIAFMALDLPHGSEVIVTSFGYAALSEVLMLLGLKPVFIEVDEHTFLMDPAAIEAAITPATKAIAPIHLYGQTCDMEVIMAIAEKHNLYVVEDTAQAIGSEYTFSNGKKAIAGTMGHIGTTSFFPSKNLGCYGDGGAVFCNNPELAQKITMIANHGQKVKYQHEIIGVNSRLDTLQAAILSVKLKHLNAFTEARNAVAKSYDEGLVNVEELSIPKRAANSTHVFHQYTLTLQTAAQRNGLKNYLADNGIPTMIYYPTALHQQKAYEQNISMPLTESLCSRVLSLPMHTEMAEEQVQYIIQHIKTYLTENK